MDTTLYEVVVLGNIIQKYYTLDKRVKIDDAIVKYLIIEYNQEKLSVKIINKDTDEEIYLQDLEFFDDVIDYDIVMDKKFLKEYLNVKQLHIEKDCDDYPEII